MARTKEVFPVRDVAGLWVAQTQTRGRSTGSGTLWFEGAAIYSYGRHFPIACILDAPNGDRVALLTERSYSNTTARHIAYVRQALRGFNGRILMCDTPTDGPLHNIQTFKRQMDAAAQSHAKARKPELYSGAIFRACASCRDYCEVFCLPVPEWAMLPDSIEPGAPLKAALAVFTAANA